MADVDVTSSSTNTVDVVGLNDIKAGITLGLVQPFKTEGLNTYEVKPLEIKPLTTTSTYDVRPLTTTNTNTYDIKPLKTDSSLAVDLKPAVVDLCLTMNVGKVPSVCIRQPYRHKIGFSLYGVDVWAFSFSGEQETVVEEMAPRPQVAVSGPGAAWPTARPPASGKEQPHEAHGSGLRIRIGP
jgi:hypothetical protein